MDIFNIIMHCLVFHVVSGAAAAYYAYRRCKVVGAAYSYGILSASVLWSVSGTLSFGLLLKFERHREWTQLTIYQFFIKQEQGHGKHHATVQRKTGQRIENC